jgi:hypothetical protein
MQPNSDNLQYIVGNDQIVEQMLKVAPLPVFSEQSISFLNEISKLLMKETNKFSDVTTFAFWCRKSALLQQKNKYNDLSLRFGKGIAFHSTPSNVPVNFAFSLAAGLLAGNANIVRLPLKNFIQVDIICGVINKLLKSSYKNMRPYVCMLKYSSSKEISDRFSSICDSRIIWGGDKTIEGLRQSPLKIKADEIIFADRYSIAVIETDKYLQAKDKTKIAFDFYNDTYFSDQNACTSPRIIFWIGKEKERAKKEFWEQMHRQIKEKYIMQPVQAVLKLSAYYCAASEFDVKLIKNNNTSVMRVVVKKIDGNIMDFKYHSGFFFEYDINSLKEMLPMCLERCQTIVYYGIDKSKFAEFLNKYRPRGVDRIVPLGQSLDFSLIWDGYDLISSLSRKITIC